MASCRVFQGCRALLAAAKGASAVPSTATKTSKGISGGGGGALTKARPAKGASAVPSTATKASKGSSGGGGGGGALTKAQPAKGASAVPSTATKASKGSSGGGDLGRARPISTALGEFLGVSEASTLDVVMKFADHIKQHNLLNPQNKKEILCDDKLKMILNGEDSIRMVDALNLLSQHFLKPS